MARTISVEQQGPTLSDDLDGRVVDGIEALRQRIVQRIRFRIRTWFLQRNEGLDYNLILGHRISAALAATALNQTILTEGGDEVTGLDDVQYSIERDSRTFRYSVMVRTIYGDMPLTTVLP